MPYIKSEDYERAAVEPMVPGELNYALTTRATLFFLDVSTLEEFRTMVEDLCREYMERTGISYTNYNNVIGALHCCGMELKRRVTPKYRIGADRAAYALKVVASDLYYGYTAPYEDDKIVENGDVFPIEVVT